MNTDRLRSIDEVEIVQIHESKSELVDIGVGSSGMADLEELLAMEDEKFYCLFDGGICAVIASLLTIHV